MRGDYDSIKICPRLLPIPAAVLIPILLRDTGAGYFVYLDGRLT